MRIAFFAALMLFCELVHAGYDLHITRKAHWADADGPTISIVEWREYVKRDSQVARDSNNTELDFVVSIPGESFPIWFDPKRGELVTKNPSERAVVKLIEIAKALRARVQGDDGELYPSERQDQSLKPSAANASSRLSHFLKTSPPNSH
ncbi:hypothetical protein [Roseateles asaccharophilus]|uniref:Uncharacterized protein n=1 Tax=Roseateles asaccharophilus TaxID=582607 RepID=A0ABU2AEH0_9BURK|nr:hypothetical protein [Roseateles asaccharophilus]MDR7335375.1 hypothetical protein [Roseateles asaccharophilus]